MNNFVGDRSHVIGAPRIGGIDIGHIEDILSPKIVSLGQNIFVIGNQNPKDSIEEAKVEPRIRRVSTIPWLQQHSNMLLMKSLKGLKSTEDTEEGHSKSPDLMKKIILDEDFENKLKKLISEQIISTLDLDKDLIKSDEYIGMVDITEPKSISDDLSKSEVKRFQAIFLFLFLILGLGLNFFTLTFCIIASTIYYLWGKYAK